MVFINEIELKKRAEHNYGRLFDLEEISLHQLNIRNIENLDKFCRQLRIIYLQDNAIAKLENLKRLKSLEYLNISMNVIEIIEGLEGCESLKKLDLTLNFVGQISSILSLRKNEGLEDLYLVDYRDFVITVLPQLKILDGTEIEISERILAKQRFAQIKESILQQEHEHCARREAERREAGDNVGDQEDQTNVNDPDDDKQEDITEKRRKYFNQKSNYTPETRVEMQKVMEEIKEEKENVGDTGTKKEKKPRQLFMKLTVNEKIFQLRLLDEIKTDSCSAKRSQTTGYLTITMQKLNYVPPPRGEAEEGRPAGPRQERLEVRSQREQQEMDFSKICENNDLPPDLEPID